MVYEQVITTQFLSRVHRSLPLYRCFRFVVGGIDRRLTIFTLTREKRARCSLEFCFLAPRGTLVRRGLVYSAVRVVARWLYPHPKCFQETLQVTPCGSRLYTKYLFINVLARSRSRAFAEHGRALIPSRVGTGRAILVLTLYQEHFNLPIQLYGISMSFGLIDQRSAAAQCLWI